MKCSTILLVLINILFLIISVLFITSGFTVHYIFGHYFYILANYNGVSVFPSLWIASGFFLLVVAIFGILISNSQNTVLINTYAILLSLALVFHVSAAITGIMLGFCRSKEIVSDTLTAFVHSYEYDAVLRETMDWTQLKFHCCGNSGPEDWIDYFKSIETVEVESSGRDENSTLASTAVTLASDTNTMPSSCCVRDSDYLNLRCENYYEFGCLQHVQEVVSANLLMASFLALGMGLLDLLGAVMGFLITKTIRRERQIDADYNQLGMKSSRY